MGQGKRLSIEVRNRMWLREIYQPGKNSSEDASQEPESMGFPLPALGTRLAIHQHLFLDILLSENSQGLALVIDTSKDSTAANSQTALPAEEKPLFGF